MLSVLSSSDEKDERAGKHNVLEVTSVKNTGVLGKLGAEVLTMASLALSLFTISVKTKAIISEIN